MSNPLISPDGRPVPPSLQTVAKINHCGDCRHAVLMPMGDGRLDVSRRTCLESPPQVIIVPLMKLVPSPIVGRPPTQQVVEHREAATYPTVAVNMRACSRWQPQSDTDKAVVAIDAADASAERPTGDRRQN